MGRRGGREDPYAGRRDEDRWQHFVAMFFAKLVWPLTVLAISLLFVLTYVYVRYGEDRLTSYLHFVQTPVVISGVGILVTVCGRVVAAVPQLGRIDRRQGQLSQQAAVSVKRIDNMGVFVTELGAKIDKLDSRVDALVEGKVGADYEEIRRQLGTMLELIERQGAQFGRAMTTITGSIRTQPHPAPEPHIEPVPAHVTGSQVSEPPPDPLDKSRPWYRDPTGMLPAVPSGPPIPPEAWGEGGPQRDLFRYATGQTGTIPAALRDEDDLLDHRLVHGTQRSIDPYSDYRDDEEEGERGPD